MEIEYSDIAYTSKNQRLVAFQRLNDDIIRDFFDNDMDIPCDACSLSLECEVSGKDCKAFRNWTPTGCYDDAAVQKHMRMPRKD